MATAFITNRSSLHTSAETIVSNFAGQVRRAALNGRTYLVAPLSLIVPGVLAGSQGPLYYPPEEIARNHQEWEGMPLVAYHPFADGKNVSANHPGVLERQGIGFVRKPHIDPLKNNRLTAEGWFDVENTRRINKSILNALERGQPIELSTGLFTENEPAQNGANYNGRGYTHIARNYKPDHVAVLPDQVGACSLRDGCGVLVNCQGDDKCNGSGDGG